MGHQSRRRQDYAECSGSRNRLAHLIQLLYCSFRSLPLRIKIDSALRRECLDRLLFWTATDLESKLCAFKTYYNEHRVHSGLGGKLPDSAGAAPINLASYGWQKHCRGLYQTPIAA